MTFGVIIIDLDPNLFTIGPFTLTWHGIFSVLGILATIRLGAWLARRHDGVDPGAVYDAAFWMVILGLIGARLLYVWENWRYFAVNGWVRVFYVTEGGISQWGGIFGAMLGLLAWTRRPPKRVAVPDLSEQPEKLRLLRWLASEGESVRNGDPIVELAADNREISVEAPASGRLTDLVEAGTELELDHTLARIDSRLSFWTLLDAAGPAALLGLAIGRIGDVINGEHHGTVTNLPWGVDYVNQHTLGQPDRIVHPEVAYEMILCLGLLAILLPFNSRLKRALPNGVTGLIYLSLYAIGRFWLSYDRADQIIALGLRQAQLACVVMVVLALVATPFLFRHRRRAEGEPAAPGPAPAPAARA